VSPAEGYSDRVIIPFKYQGRIVGSTGRKITKGKPKYLSDQHPNFVFNVDEQLDDSKYVFVVEGPFDALAIGGVALLSNNISEQQAKIINRLHKHVIVIPDQDKAGLDVIDKARDLGWSVAFPTWDSDVKDCSDAVNRYGKLFVIMDLIKTATERIYKNKSRQRSYEKKATKCANLIRIIFLPFIRIREKYLYKKRLKVTT